MNSSTQPFKKPPVLILSTAVDISGGEVFLLSLVEKMSRWTPFVVTPNPRLAERCESLGVKAAVVPGFRGLGRSKPLLALWRLVVRQPVALLILWKLAIRTQAKVIMAGSFSSAHFAFALSWLTKKPALWSHQHPVLKPTDKDAGVARWLVEKGGLAVAACSGAVAKGFGLSGPDAAAVRVIANSVDAGHFQRSHPAPGGRPLHVGLVAMISEWKGHELLLEATRLLRERGWSEEHFICEFFGEVFENREKDHQHKQRLLEKIAAYGLQDQVLFRGKQSDMKAVYETLDIVLNCSLEPEPLGISIVEAMSMECIVIVPDEGGPGEIVTHGRDGFKFAPRSISDLADKMEHVIRENASLGAIRRMARQTACLRYSSDDMAAQYEKLFDALAEGRR